MYLNGVCAENTKTDEIRQAKALEDFEVLIHETIGHGATDRETAIRWLMEGEGIDIDWSQDIEHFFWNQGLSWEKIHEFTSTLN